MSILFLVIFAAAGFLFSNAHTFTLRSRDLSGQATQSQVYNSFGCTGCNISPGLNCDNAPKESRALQ